MKNELSTLMVFTALAVLLSACAATPAVSLPSGNLSNAVGQPTEAQPEPAAPAPAATEPQPPSQQHTLRLMAEEEQMARDIYNALYLQTSQKVFQNIASSEQTHTETLSALMVASQMAALPGTPGHYEDAGLQSLYDSLMAQAAQGTLQALQTGALVEETDIRDLRLAIAASTDPQVIEAYQQLLQGSYNHLAAFASAIQRQGGPAYQAQLLPAEDVAAILAQNNSQQGGAGTGNGNGQGGGSQP